MQKRSGRHRKKFCLNEARVAYGIKIERQFESNNIREVWKGMRTITGYKAGGITTVGNSERANEFNTFFNRFDSSATPALPLPASAPSGPMHCPHQLPNTVSFSTTFTTEQARQELWRLQETFVSGEMERRRSLYCSHVCKFFWGQIEAALPHMVHITPAQDVLHAVTTSLQPIDEFFLFMNDLSLDLVQKDLAHRFKVHQSTVNPIMDTRANCLYEVLGTIGICTFKVLIGIAPHGSVTFISPLYEGSISDREILKQSGLVSLLKPSRAIMVDKGFLLEDLVPYKVYIPAFLHKKSQLSGAEVRKTQSTARLRVHKKGEGTQISLSLTGSINQLSAVVCLLVNYQNGPVVKAWAR
ncbi:hypothetical protein WMY93_034355 [Mugilogobius chulae]|uniref:DDE Tnp4 domain-containing protein n=1 Tax=Mugilogobius chulae TaxID=88201 RepID=A0AAW0MGI2_9GOBI